MTTYTPYTYLIGWSEHDKWYYGAKWAKGCHPSTFWKDYWTSSKEVAIFRKKYGEPDIIQIRKTFTKRLDAQMWENKVLHKMKVIYDDRWLNGCAFPILKSYKKPENTTNYKIAALKRWKNKEFKIKQKQRKWYHNDDLQKSKMFLPEDVLDNWKLGRVYYNKKDPNHKRLGKKFKRVICENCNKDYGINNIIQHKKICQNI